MLERVDFGAALLKRRRRTAERVCVLGLDCEHVTETHMKYDRTAVRCALVGVRDVILVEFEVKRLYARFLPELPNTK